MLVGTQGTGCLMKLAQDISPHTPPSTGYSFIYSLKEAETVFFLNINFFPPWYFPLGSMLGGRGTTGKKALKAHRSLPGFVF